MRGRTEEVRRAKESDIADVVQVLRTPNAIDSDVTPASIRDADANPLASLRTFPDGAVIARFDDGGVAGFVQAIRMTRHRALSPHRLADHVRSDGTAMHDVTGPWLYVGRLILAFRSGIGGNRSLLPLLLDELVASVDRTGLEGLAVAVPFPGRRERSGDTAYQQASLLGHDAPAHIDHLVQGGYAHELGLPHYFEDDQHAALLVRRFDLAQ